MAGFFRYHPQGFPGVGTQSGANKFRQFLALLKGTHVAVVDVVIPAGTSGSYAITGLGFQPAALLLFSDGANQDVLNVDGQVAALGCAVSASDRWSVSLSSDFGDTGTRSSAAADDQLIYTPVTKTSSDPYYYDFICDLVSLDADGFTIDVSASTIDVRLQGLAMAHPTGGFACGTALTPLVTGDQAITGLGFQPGAVLLASSQATALGLHNTGSYMAVGVADDGNGDHGIWTGAKNADPYIDMTAYSKAISLQIDTDGAGPFTATVLSEAVLDSFDGDGFTLDWTTVDGAARYYHWFAVEKAVEGNRFTFNSGTGDQNIVTRDDPKGLFFFSNDMGTEGRDHNTQTFGQSWGFGFCGPLPALHQGTISGGATAEHTFPFAELSSRYGSVTLAFGAGGRGSDSLSPQPEDYGKIINLSHKRQAQIYRRPWNIGLGSGPVIR